MTPEEKPAKQKTAKLLAELESDAEPIERKRQGLGKPNLIYLIISKSPKSI